MDMVYFFEKGINPFVFSEDSECKPVIGKKLRSLEMRCTAGVTKFYRYPDELERNGDHLPV